MAWLGPPGSRKKESTLPLRSLFPALHPTPSLLFRELSWAEDVGLDVQSKERLHPSVGVVSPTPHGGPFLLLRAVLPGRQGARTPEGSSFKGASGDWEWQVACSQDGARSCFLGSVPEETLHWGLLTGRRVVRSQAGPLCCPGANAVCPGDGGPPDSPCCSELFWPNLRAPHTELSPRDYGARNGDASSGFPNSQVPRLGCSGERKRAASYAACRAELPQTVRTFYSLAGSVMKQDRKSVV